ncbi:hypothetical protein KUV56_08285 [Ferrimonas balearica]|uniref:hypothetical protein n=1 Tax=Ferrimonas balearica TaxID=44012 RepID=UPI001C582BE8|nr:hypothetical protein [Ferrimonas balearica]MBW3139511.1 hypothetical protein [Ferrimonas balearica]
MKNWTVITQAVKDGTSGLKKRERYLTSSSHPNHKNTVEIVELNGDKRTLIKTSLAGESFRVYQKLSGKGGRPLTSFAMEFCFTLPKSIRPSIKEWKIISDDIINSICEKLELSEEEKAKYISHCRCVLHRQENTMISGTGDHIHMICPKVFNKRILTSLQKKSFTNFLKQVYNHTILSNLKIDVLDYSPSVMSKMKRLQVWKYTLYQLKLRKTDLIAIEKISKKIDELNIALEENNQKQISRITSNLNRIFSDLPQEIRKVLDKSKKSTSHKIDM